MFVICKDKKMRYKNVYIPKCRILCVIDIFVALVLSRASKLNREKATWALHHGSWSTLGRSHILLYSYNIKNVIPLIIHQLISIFCFNLKVQTQLPYFKLKLINKWMSSIMLFSLIQKREEIWAGDIQYVSIPSTAQSIFFR